MPSARNAGAGDFLALLQYAEQSVELEAENWRLLVQLELGSWKLRTGDFLVQL